jgi:hypothetical protein
MPYRWIRSIRNYITLSAAFDDDHRNAGPFDPHRRQHGAAGRRPVEQGIPGVTGAQVYVGRPLKGLAGRKFIADRLPNTQENLMRWIRNPREVDPQTAMPVLGVSEADARDISAYLLSRR